MGYTLGQARAYLTAVAQEEARRDRDLMVVLRTAINGSAEAYREVLDHLNGLTRTRHG
jgi:hypothetical protein